MRPALSLSVVSAGVALLLTSCSSGRSIYLNDRNPSYGQTELDRDVYECSRENTYHSTVVVGSYGMAGPEVNHAMVRQCVAARGWRQVKEAEVRPIKPSQNATTPPSAKTPPAKPPLGPCESGMYWHSVKKGCVPYSDR
jgi:hypothetical protein